VVIESEVPRTRALFAGGSGDLLDVRPFLLDELAESATASASPVERKPRLTRGAMGHDVELRYEVPELHQSCETRDDLGRAVAQAALEVLVPLARDVVDHVDVGDGWEVTERSMQSRVRVYVPAVPCQIQSNNEE
jgi:hypothetical protein